MSLLKIKSVRVKNVTAISSLYLEFSPGINVFIGEHSTGKTHLMKLLYATVCSKGQADESTLIDKVSAVFACNMNKLRRIGTFDKLYAHTLFADGHSLGFEFNDGDIPYHARVIASEALKRPALYLSPVIPDASENSSCSDGASFNSPLIDSSIINDMECLIWNTIRPQTRAFINFAEDVIHKKIGGKLRWVKPDMAFKTKNHNVIQLSMLSGSIANLAVLACLIEHGYIHQDSVLFWDHPETSADPAMVGFIVEVLLGLQRLGVQVFITTHDYVVMKELDLQTTKTGGVKFHSFSRNQVTGETNVSSASSYQAMENNIIHDAYMGLYDRDVTRAVLQNLPKSYNTI